VDFITQRRSTSTVVWSKEKRVRGIGGRPRATAKKNSDSPAMYADVGALLDREKGIPARANSKCVRSNTRTPPPITSTETHIRTSIWRNQTCR